MSLIGNYAPIMTVPGNHERDCRPWFCASSCLLLAVCTQLCGLHALPRWAADLPDAMSACMRRPANRRRVSEPWEHQLTCALPQQWLPLHPSQSCTCTDAGKELTCRVCRAAGTHACLRAMNRMPASCAGGECGVIYTQRWGINMPQQPGYNTSTQLSYPLGERCAAFPPFSLLECKGKPGFLQ